MNVTIKEQKVAVFADTGADICVMSRQTARKLNLDIQKTKMRIRPYGSSPKKYLEEYTGTIMFNANVVNARIYIITQKVETLLSGLVCEELGFINFTGDNI